MSEIVNSAVVSKYDDLWGEIPFGFVVVENGKSIKNRQQFETQVVGLVEAEIGKENIEIYTFSYVFWNLPWPLFCFFR